MSPSTERISEPGCRYTALELSTPPPNSSLSLESYLRAVACPRFGLGLLLGEGRMMSPPPRGRAVERLSSHEARSSARSPRRRLIQSPVLEEELGPFVNSFVCTFSGTSTSGYPFMRAAQVTSAVVSSTAS